MNIYALNTGFMSVKRRYVDARGSNRLMRLLSVLADKEFQKIPVYTCVIEHPQGVILVDTGLTTAMLEPEYFPITQASYWLTQYRFHVNREDEVAAQLRSRGIYPEDVRWVVLTHTHFDHTGTIHDFPQAEFVISRKEHEDTLCFRSAHFAFPSKWPAWFQPQVIDFVPERLGTFEQSFQLVDNIFLVPVPGHTNGQMAVVAVEHEQVVLFAADASFDVSSLLRGTMDAPAFNAIKDRHTRQKILDYAQTTPLVYLSTHDVDTPTRLEQRTPLIVQATSPMT